MPGVSRRRTSVTSIRTLEIGQQIASTERLAHRRAGPSERNPVTRPLVAIRAARKGEGDGLGMARRTVRPQVRGGAARPRLPPRAAPLRLAPFPAGPRAVPRA